MTAFLHAHHATEHTGLYPLVRERGTVAAATRSHPVPTGPA
jgi:hypothetical protein